MTPQKSVMRQNIRFSHLDINDGLSNSYVRTVIQDRQGFMWFGTWNGLNRYDGYTFKIYKRDPDNTNSLSDNLVSAMCEDEDGIFWIGTGAGELNRFDPRSETFTHYRHDPGDPGSFCGSFILSLCLDAAGMLWIGTLENGLDRFDPDDETFTHYHADPDDPHGARCSAIYALAVAPGGVVWAGTGNGLCRFDPQSGHVVHYIHDPQDVHSISKGEIYSLLVDLEGMVWAGTTEGGVSLFDAPSGQFIRYDETRYPDRGLDNNPIRSLYRDSLGYIWIGGSNGLYQMDPETGQLVWHQHSLADRNGLTARIVRAIYEDRSGLIWLGLYEGGLNVFMSRPSPFQNYVHDVQDPHSLGDRQPSALCTAQDGTIWVGTSSGMLDKLDRETGRFTHYRFLDETILNNIVVIGEDADGRLWFGGSQKLGIFCLDPRTEQVECYQYDSSDAHSLSNNHVLSIYQDTDGVLWIGTNIGLNRFDSVRQRFDVFWLYPDKPTSMDNSIRAICQDRDGWLWLGSWYSGLHCFDPRTGQFRHYRHDPRNPASFSSDAVHCLHLDVRGRLWIGTSSGLCRFEPQTETFVTYTTRDGLLSDTIYGILEDESGRLWLGTTYGLSRFDPRLETFKNYDTYDGLFNNQFASGSYCKGLDGALFFGAIDALTVFYPDQVQDNAYMPPVVLTDFFLFNRPVPVAPDSHLTQALWATETITLGPDDYVFAFEFASLSYIASQKNSFKYKLEGFDQDWNVVTSKRRFASYSNLAAGEYVFRVMGSNNDGLWNEAGVSVKVIVTQPLWQTLLAEKEAAEAASRAKSRFLSNMSHELRTPLNAILGFTDLMLRDQTLTLKQRENLGIISHSGEHLLVLINDVLELSKIEAGKTELRLQTFDLHQLILDLGEMFSLQAEQKGVSIVFDLAPGVPQYIHSDEGKLRQVLINLLDNAVKFTEHGGIMLRVKHNNALSEYLVLTIEIQDTGRGIAIDELGQVFESFVQTESGRQSGQGTGLGLPLSREHVQLMGGELTVHSVLGQGSTFVVELPVQVVDSSQTSLAQSARRVVGVEHDARAPDGQLYRLLVVDDEEINRRLLIEILAPLGFALREASDGREAVSIWQEWTPHLIWMDVSMPVLDGRKATQLIKSEPKGAETAIIFMTASIFRDERQRQDQMGGDDFIRKPFRENQIFDVLSRHLGVRFVYENEALFRRTRSLDSLWLRDLPGEWVSMMRRALVIGDVADVTKLIGLLPGPQSLVDELRKRARQFEYDLILRWIDGE